MRLGVFKIVGHSVFFGLVFAVSAAYPQQVVDKSVATVSDGVQALFKLDGRGEMAEDVGYLSIYLSVGRGGTREPFSFQREKPLIYKGLQRLVEVL